MHNYNDQFKSNPLQFIANNTINNIIWFQRAVSSAGTYEQKQWIEMCDTNKKASFDLQVHNKQQNTFELALSNPLSNNGSAIDAYWCPLIKEQNIVASLMFRVLILYTTLFLRQQ